MEKKHIALAMTRISLGFIFLWPFLDKAFGLGYSTCRDRATGEYLGALCGNAWLAGGSPTMGFLSGVEGPFSWLFNPLAGHPVVNVLFMFGLLGVGVALTLGAGLRVAAWSGGIMLVAMWLAEWGTFATNPFMDDHLIYTMVLFVLAYFDAGDSFGLGQWWKSKGFVQRNPWLA